MPLKKNVIVAPYEFSDYIHTAEDAKATISVAFDDGDPAVITKMLGAVARSKGMAALSEETGLTRNSLYKALADGSNPLFATVVKVADALGYEIAVKPKRDEKAVRRPALTAKAHGGFRAPAMAKTASARPKAASATKAIAKAAVAKKATATKASVGPKKAGSSKAASSPKASVKTRRHSAGKSG
ncbi:addiction module antidote protein [Beijerinckia sp. L45]|uniref:addiction module antidote protein n=1 Tax=Beijerinckia sp. L45 TaxID=1641855 RepID=UPI00131E7862|nr:addiction module antidote protein [Beijerinckia sp. L45]